MVSAVPVHVDADGLQRLQHGAIDLIEHLRSRVEEKSELKINIEKKTIFIRFWSNIEHKYVSFYLVVFLLGLHTSRENLHVPLQN